MTSHPTSAPVAPWAIPVPICHAPSPRWEVYCPDGAVRHADPLEGRRAAAAFARSAHDGCPGGTHLGFDLDADPSIETGGAHL